MRSTPNRRNAELNEHERRLKDRVHEQMESIKMRCTIRLYVARTGSTLKVIAAEIGLPEWRLREFLLMASLDLLEFEAVGDWCVGKPTRLPEFLVVALVMIVSRASGAQAVIMWADVVEAVRLACEKIGRPLTREERDLIDLLSRNDF
jgi:hypothetical protein